MVKEDNQADVSAEHISHADEINDFDHVLHGKEKWWNWRVMMNRKRPYQDVITALI